MSAMVKIFGQGHGQGHEKHLLLEALCGSGYGNPGGIV
jgi:hypothetical protein